MAFIISSLPDLISGSQLVDAPFHISGVPRRLVDKAGEEGTADLVKHVENCINHDWDEPIRKRGSRASRDMMTMVRGRNNIPKRCHRGGKAESICNALKREPPTQPQPNHPERELHVKILTCSIRHRGHLTWRLRLQSRENCLSNGSQVFAVMILFEGSYQPI